MEKKRKEIAVLDMKIKKNEDNKSAKQKMWSTEIVLSYGVLAGMGKIEAGWKGGLEK